MSAFDRAVAEVLRHEGGLVKDPSDPGGLTKFGISQRSYPGLGIAALTEAEAIEIYRQDYWTPIRGDELPPALALCVFDASVNQGVTAAILMLQEVVGVARDGILGPVTLKAVQGRVPVEAVVVDYLAARAMRYAFSSQLSRYGRGWYRRLFGIHHAAMGLQGG